MAEIDALLAQAVALNASDVHVMTGSPPMCRIHGMLEKMGDAEAVTDDLARRLFLEMLNDRQREQFEQLWAYTNPVDARAFFDMWWAQLAEQDLSPYEKFARMIEKHWDGIAAYCKPENKVALGFVEGFNNKIRVIQRRAFGLRDEDYLALKILTLGLPEL